MCGGGGAPGGGGGGGGGGAPGGGGGGGGGLPMPGRGGGGGGKELDDIADRGVCGLFSNTSTSSLLVKSVKSNSETRRGFLKFKINLAIT